MSGENIQHSGKMAVYVLDTSFFLYTATLDGVLFTTHEVVRECIDPASEARVHVLRERGLTVTSPRKETVLIIKEASGKTGDIGKLSETDLGILALALEKNAVICSDDFAIRNVAMALGIDVQPMMQRKIRFIPWKFRCKGCARYYDKAMVCPVCGAEVTRKLK